MYYEGWCIFEIWRVTLLYNIALNTIEAERVELARCCCEIVWAHKLELRVWVLSEVVQVGRR